jgi:hypothetical protein
MRIRINTLIHRIYLTVNNPNNQLTLQQNFRLMDIARRLSEVVKKYY